MTFHIDRATAHDAGDYVLHGRNRYGQVQSATFSLKMAGEHDFIVTLFVWLLLRKG